MNRDVYMTKLRGKWSNGLGGRHVASKRVVQAREFRKKNSSNEKKKYMIFQKSEEVRLMDPKNDAALPMPEPSQTYHVPPIIGVERA